MSTYGWGRWEEMGDQSFGLEEFLSNSNGDDKKLLIIDFESLKCEYKCNRAAADRQMGLGGNAKLPNV